VAVPSETGLAPAKVSLAHSLGPVADDWAAAQVWLAILKARPVAATTLATYQREIRRLRWYCEQRQRPLPSAWTYQDTLAYGEFLQHEAHQYVCPPGLRPHHPGWTPFRGRLASQSIAAAHKIAGQLFAFWQAAGYILRSPYSGWGQARKVARESPSHRAVPPPLIELVLRCMEERKKRTPLDYLRYYRNRFVMVLLLGTGLRAHEAVACDMTDVAPYSDPDPAQPKLYWGLRLRVQKGGKDERTVYLDAPVMQAFRAYRRAFGLPPEPQRAETYGLVLSPLTERSQGRNAKHRRRGGRWRSVRCRQSAWGIIKAEFGAAAQVLRKVGKEAEASLLEQVSTHWLRHSLATDLVLRGHDIRLVAEVLRHDDIRTSMRYTHLGLIDVARALSNR
jgi:site-specific recombinase XerD